MQVWDISLSVSANLPVWPGDPPVQLERYLEISAGNIANVSHLSCGVHVGTHVDAPVHFIEKGLATEELPLDILIGPALVVEVHGEEAITPSHLDALKVPVGTARLLLKTPNSALWTDPYQEFYPDFVALTPEAAIWMVEKGVRLVGIDYLSVQTFRDPEPLTHRTLLGAGVVIVEGLNLQKVPPGSYQFVCLPVKLVGSDGSPARAVLIKE